MVVFIQIYTYRCTVIQFTYIVKATYKSFKTRHPRSVQQQSDSACETAFVSPFEGIYLHDATARFRRKPAGSSPLF